MRSILANLRDPAADQRVLKAILQYIRREPTKMFRAGPISLWVVGGFDVERIEALLEHLVTQGVLRLATAQELVISGFKIGYYLADGGLEHLPPEDRSYGAI